MNYWEGYVINKDSVKLEGLIKNENGMSLNDAKKKFINFIAKKNGEKYKLYPKDILGYGIKFQNQYVSSGKLFLQVIKLGKQINLFKHVKDKSFMSAPDAGGMVGSYNQLIKTTYYFQKKGSKQFKKVEKHKFKQRFMEYFADCIHLQSKIINGELGHRQAEEIAAIYNGCPLQ